MEAKALKGASDGEVSQHAVKIVQSGYLRTDDIVEQYNVDLRAGRFNKDKDISQKEALDKAYKEAEEDLDGLYSTVINRSDFDVDTHLTAARRAAVMDKLARKAENGENVSVKLMNIIEKDVAVASNAGRALNAQKMILITTPEGRLRLVTKEVERLNEKYGKRLKGNKIELSEDQIARILKSDATDEEISETLDKIGVELWDDIPAMWFEKWNEIRHCAMLFNIKTHGRNLTGNAVFKVARSVSDGIEIAAYKIPAIKKRVAKFDGNVDMVYVKRSEYKKCKDVLDKEFEKNYKESGSKNRFIESTRPDGSPAVKNKAVNWFIKTNYKLLEKEDLVILKPEYQKNYVRWCKTRNIELDDMAKMTDAQKVQANDYALRQAEKATFIDDSVMARTIIGWKQKTAGAKAGHATPLLRAGNVVLESTLPFVKTPINIFRRSMDYSPVGLARSIIELSTATTEHAFKQGIHHMATGLTGTGVFTLGMYLANKDMVTVQTGEVSGDSYYDRDMGYQDYSLIGKWGGKEHSLTIDWLSPMQTSLFMGAAAFNNLGDKGFNFTDMLQGITMAITMPTLDMSFMSSPKDTMETFMNKITGARAKGEDMSQAVTDALFSAVLGNIPQGYVSGFVPQVIGQIAIATDKKQRDTRSTKDDSLAASWDSFWKKQANKIPGIRQLLNPKINREGNDVRIDGNIVTKVFNAFANPSNVKTITMNDTDRELIKIYNNMPEDTSKEKDAKQFFFYNFTGNPSYYLNNGKRMTYDELYKYGKSSRTYQNTKIKAMISSDSYKNMTWGMKSSEVDSVHWISNTKADQTVYGSKYAADGIAKHGNSTDATALSLSRQSGGSDKDFVSFVIKKEAFISRAHATDWYTKSIAFALYGNDEMAQYYTLNVDKLKNARQYISSGGSAKEYTNATCNIVSDMKKGNASSEAITMRAFAAANYKINERTYLAMCMDNQLANMGVGLKKYGYTYGSLAQHGLNAKYGFDLDKSGGLNKKEIVAYIDCLGISSNIEKACLFKCFSDSKYNPYGSISNYLGFGNTSSSGVGYGRGKTSKAKATKEKAHKMPSWDDYVKDFISNSEKIVGVQFKDWDSPLDASYRKKIQKIISNGVEKS